MRYKLHLEPREWQRAALAKWVDAGHRGVIEVATGGGKTLFALQCFLAVQDKNDNVGMTILVPTIPLVDQWYLCLKEELGVSRSEIAIYGGGLHQNHKAQFVISVLNTAREYETPPWDLDRLLVVDECHRAGSERNSQALKEPYRYTLGISATPIRQYDDGFQNNIVPNLGPLIFKYSLAQAEADGVLSPFEIMNVQFDLLEHEQSAYDSLSRRIAYVINSDGPDSEKLPALLRTRARISNRSLMRIPLTVALMNDYRGQRTLIFHEEIASARRICKLLEQNEHSVAAYHSKIGASTRLENLQLFKRGIYDILVCCRALDEGINVPEANVALIAASTASRRQRIQRLGRVLRPTDGKAQALVITLYATPPEGERLAEEQKQLEGVVNVTWQSAGRANGTDSY